MADGTSGWLNGWLQTAKEKSSSVYEFMKKDLDEFTNTIQQETSSFVTSTTATLREKLNIDDTESTANKVKRSVSGILGSVGNVLTISPDDEDDDVPFVIRDSEPVVLSRFELQVVLLQRETSTYLIEPPGKLEDYEAWLDKFELNVKREEMTELMSTNAHVRAQYGHLVPTQVSHSLFWHRYFYRVHQLYVAEAKRSSTALMQKTVDENDVEALELAFDDDDDKDRRHRQQQQLTPQETDRILSDYQRECEERELQSRLASLDLNIAPENQLQQSSVSSVFTPPKSLADEINDVKHHHEQPQASDLRDEAKSVPIPENESSSQDGTKCCSSLTGGMEISPSSKVSELSNDDEWVKDFDVGVTYEEVHKALQQNPAELVKSQVTQIMGDEEWEKWQ